LIVDTRLRFISTQTIRIWRLISLPKLIRKISFWRFWVMTRFSKSSICFWPIERKTVSHKVKLHWNLMSMTRSTTPKRCSIWRNSSIKRFMILKQMFDFPSISWRIIFNSWRKSKNKLILKIRLLLRLRTELRKPVIRLRHWNRLGIVWPSLWPFQASIEKHLDRSCVQYELHLFVNFRIFALRVYFSAWVLYLYTSFYINIFFHSLMKGWPIFITH
jgi:hypothetical protein